MAAKEKETEIRALLVEDNDIIIESLSEIMKSMGFTVVSSKLGSEAINLIAGGSLGIVIADDKCGDKEGLEVLEEAKRDFSSFSSTYHSSFQIHPQRHPQLHCSSHSNTQIYVQLPFHFQSQLHLQPLNVSFRVQLQP